GGPAPLELAPADVVMVAVQSVDELLDGQGMDHPRGAREREVVLEQLIMPSSTSVGIPAPSPPPKPPCASCWAGRASRACSSCGAWESWMTRNTSRPVHQATLRLPPLPMLMRSQGLSTSAPARQ